MLPVAVAKSCIYYVTSSTRKVAQDTETIFLLFTLEPTASIQRKLTVVMICILICYVGMQLVD